MHTHTHKCAHGHTPQRRMFGKEGGKQPLFRSVRTNTISIDTFLFIYIHKSSWNLILLNCKPSRENSANETHVDIPQTHLRLRLGEGTKEACGERTTEIHTRGTAPVLP